MPYVLNIFVAQSVLLLTGGFFLPSYTLLTILLLETATTKVLFYIKTFMSKFCTKTKVV